MNLKVLVNGPNWGGQKQYDEEERTRHFFFSFLFFIFLFFIFGSKLKAGL